MQSRNVSACADTTTPVACGALTCRPKYTGTPPTLSCHSSDLTWQWTNASGCTLPLAKRQGSGTCAYPAEPTVSLMAQEVATSSGGVVDQWTSFWAQKKSLQPDPAVKSFPHLAGTFVTLAPESEHAFLWDQGQPWRLNTAGFTAATWARFKHTPLLINAGFETVDSGWSVHGASAFSYVMDEQRSGGKAIRVCLLCAEIARSVFGGTTWNVSM